MTNIHLRLRSFFPAVCIVFFMNVSALYSQQIVRISPPNITIRGVSIADYYHVMFVGDSASVLINTDTITSGGSQDFILLPVPVSRNVGFYGISYYDSLHAIIVGDAGIILRTNDKGKNWLQQTMGSNPLRAVTRITGNIFQIVGDGGTILRSTDNGASWSQIPSGTTKALYAEAFGSANIGLAAGEAGTMLKTTDGGLSWNPQTQAGIPHLNFYGVAMSGEDTATAVGDSSLIRYTEDGIIWQTRRSSNYFDDTSYYPRTASLRAILYTGSSGIGTHNAPYPNPSAETGGDGDISYFLYNRIFEFVVKSKSDTIWTEYDTAWAPVSLGRVGDADGGIDVQPFRLNCMAIYNSGGRFLSYLAGQYGEIFVDTAIFTWVLNTSPLHPSDDNFLFTSFDDHGFGYATVTGSLVRRTNDNGLTWKDVLAGQDVSGVFCQDSNTAFVAGWNGELFRTTNGGVKWDSIPQISQYRLHGFSFISHDTGFCVGDGGTILRTYDGGSTWQDKSPPYPSFLKVIAFSSSDTGVAVGDNGTLIRTTDGGDSWTYNGDQPLAGTEASLRYIQAFPDGTYFVGADSAVMKSSDHGQTWIVIDTPPDSVGISFYDTKIGIIGKYSTTSELVPDSVTFGYTTDGGKTWPKNKEFIVPYYNVHRLLAHWINGHTFLLYGIDGFIMKVDVQALNAVTEIISPGSSPMKVYPNPSVQKNVMIEYQTEKEGEIMISLYDELGKQVAILYTGYEVSGKHERVLTLDPNLHGTFFIRADESGKVQTLRMIKL